MSETPQVPQSKQSTRTEPGAHPAHGIRTAHEAYAFACMRCGHGWEQSYDIEHHIDAKGQEFVTYIADGMHVPSPLTRPTCLNCGSHVVRIMRSGQVSSVQRSLRHDATEVQESPKHPKHPEPSEPSAAGGAPAQKRHWHFHFSDLLHPFQRRHAA